VVPTGTSLAAYYVPACVDTLAPKVTGTAARPNASATPRIRSAIAGHRRFAHAVLAASAPGDRQQEGASDQSPSVRISASAFDVRTTPGRMR